MNMRRLLVALGISSVLVGGCGSQASERAGDDRGKTSSTNPAGGKTKGGWLDGSPAEADTAVSRGAADDGYSEKELASTASKEPAPGGPSTTIAGSGHGPSPSPEPPIPGDPAPPVLDTALSAGTVDDNAKFEDYLLYRQAALATGIDVHDVDPNGRYIFHVHDADGHPVLGATVLVEDGTGDDLASLKTHADGSAVAFLPAASGDGQQSAKYQALISKGDVNTKVTLSGDRSIDVPLDVASAAANTKVDVLFAIDATGSMGDEIEQLKANMVKVSESIAALETKPDVRFGMTVFRDEGDAFVTRTFDLTNDVSAFVKGLRDVQADGGGDTPEAVNEALGEALSKPSWRGDDTIKLLFLVGDAAPHIEKDPDYITSITTAASAGIKIHPIASSGLDDQGEFIFRQFALMTGGKFNFLTYGAGGAPTPGDTTTHHVEGYAVLSLDALVVQLVKDELSALGGSPSAPAPEKASAE